MRILWLAVGAAKRARVAVLARRFPVDTDRLKQKTTKRNNPSVNLTFVSSLQNRGEAHRTAAPLNTRFEDGTPLFPIPLTNTGSGCRRGKLTFALTVGFSAARSIRSVRRRRTMWRRGAKL